MTDKYGTTVVIARHQIPRTGAGVQQDGNTGPVAASHSHLGMLEGPDDVPPSLESSKGNPDSPPHPCDCATRITPCFGCQREKYA